ncbi:MAG: ATP-binding cassette domain-containing protein [Paracoccaceae bacterium]
MLHLENLRLTEGDWSLTADWQIDAGAKVAVIGPSGAGKSSLLSAIGGFFTPATGRILWQGRDLADMSPGDRPVSFLFQDQNLFPHLTLAQNLGLGLSPRLRLDTAQHRAVEQALERVGLSGLGDRKPGQVSGGQQGRAALARALLRARPVLLLDEPFAALGPALKVEMLDLVADVADENGATVMLVTHDPQDARRFSDLTVLVEGGVAHPPAATEPLFANPSPALAAYLGQ